MTVILVTRSLALKLLSRSYIASNFGHFCVFTDFSEFYADVSKIFNGPCKLTFHQGFIMQSLKKI